MNSKKNKEIASYQSPTFELIDVTIEQNVLANGSVNGDGAIDNFSGEVW